MISFITTMAWIIGVILTLIFCLGILPYLFSSTITIEVKGMIIGRSLPVWLGIITCVVWIIVQW